MLYTITEAYSKVGNKNCEDDDAYDRFSRRWTILLLAVCIIAVSAKQFVGDPIKCLTPTYFEGEHSTYAQNYCWITAVYRIDEHQTLTPTEKKQYYTNYYIWVPFILVGACLLTYLPSLIWESIGHKATVDIPALSNFLVNKKHTIASDDYDKTLKAISQHYSRSLSILKADKNCILKLNRLIIKISLFFIGGGPLTAAYFLVKILYLINACGQLYLMHLFLEVNFIEYGKRIFQGLVKGGDWESTVRFPRYGFCDYTFRALGDNNINHTTQCTLPVNLYNERIFAFYWCWLILIGIITVIGIIQFLIGMSYYSRRSFIKQHLRRMETVQTKMTSKEIWVFNEFCEEYLGGDGILFLRIIHKNMNSVFVGDLLQQMWKDFYITKKD